jgi:hypothetical protein
MGAQENGFFLIGLTNAVGFVLREAQAKLIEPGEAWRRRRPTTLLFFV